MEVEILRSKGSEERKMWTVRSAEDVGSGRERLQLVFCFSARDKTGLFLFLLGFFHVLFVLFLSILKLPF